MGKAIVLFTTCALCIALVVPCFASTALTGTRLGFYQVHNSPPPTYSRIGSTTSSSMSVSASEYDQGGMCWIGSRFQYQSADLPIDKDWIQLTLVLTFNHPTNAIPSEYQNDDFFPNILYVDNSLIGDLGYDNIAYQALKQLKPVRVSSVITSERATLNIMLTKQQFIDISTPRSSGRFYHTWIFPQISSNYMISQLAHASDHYVGLVSITALRWSDTSDIVPIDEQTLRALTELNSTVQDGFTAVLDEHGKTNEKLDGIQSSLDNQDQKEWDFGSDKVGNGSDSGMFSGVDLGIGVSDIEKLPIYGIKDSLGALFLPTGESSVLAVPEGDVFGVHLWDAFQIDFSAYENESVDTDGYIRLCHTCLKVFAWVAFAVFTFRRISLVIGVVSGENPWSSLWDTAVEDTPVSLFHQDDDPVDPLKGRWRS